MCIVGTDVVGRIGSIIRGSFVHESLVMWDSAKKGSSDPDDDYHGNFNAELFEIWFTKLCMSLQQDYGECSVHLDGAMYHKRVTNPVPTTATKKDLIQKWLADNGTCLHLIFICLLLLINENQMKTRTM